MKQPDRFERMVDREFEKAWNECNGAPNGWPIMAALLRREHAAIVRMVNNRVPKKAWSPDVRLGYGQAVMDILDRLARRRR